MSSEKYHRTLMCLLPGFLNLKDISFVEKHPVIRHFNFFIFTALGLFVRNTHLKNMHFKKEAALLAISISLLTVFFLLPRNQQWAARIFFYWQRFSYESKHTGREERMQYRFGNDYIFSKKIAEVFIRSGDYDTALVVLPPANYFKGKGITYNVPEPAVFYYYTGLKTVWTASDQAVKAGWYVRANGKALVIEKVNDRRQLQDTINMFRKSAVSL
jgi:hypothetical protein